MARSNWWYVLPLLFGFLGGLIAFFAIKSNDKDKAYNVLFLGIVITAFHVFMNIGFFLAIGANFGSAGFGT